MYPPNTSKEEQLAAIQMELMGMLRSWHRASQYVMQWLKSSPGQPVEPVSHNVDEEI